MKKFTVWCILGHATVQPVIVRAAGEIYFTRHDQKVLPMDIGFWVIWMVKTHFLQNSGGPILLTKEFGPPDFCKKWLFDLYMTSEEHFNGWNKSLLRLWLSNRVNRNRSWMLFRWAPWQRVTLLVCILKFVRPLEFELIAPIPEYTDLSFYSYLRAKAWSVNCPASKDLGHLWLDFGAPWQEWHSQMSWCYHAILPFSALEGTSRKCPTSLILEWADRIQILGPQIIDYFTSQQTWSGFPPTTVPDQHCAPGLSPTTVPEMSNGMTPKFKKWFIQRWQNGN